MNERTAIFLMAGPEMPRRLVHAFIWALDLASRGGKVKIVLEGASPDWLWELPNPEHEHHSLYQRVKEQGLIDAVCMACAMQAEALEAAMEEEIRIVNDASGHVSLAPYLEAGYQIVVL
jgi:predicted peroxiredoxin